MHEATLKDFLVGTAPVSELSADLEGCMTAVGPNEASVEIHDAVGEFTLTPVHLGQIIDAVVAGHLEPWKLEPIGFCIVASDYFVYDCDTPEGDRVANVVHMWAAPQVNYPLTLKNVTKFREFARTGIDPFTPADRLERPEIEWRVARVSKRFAGRTQ